MQKVLILGLIALALFSAAIPAQAFDGHRKGLALGGGLGLGVALFEDFNPYAPYASGDIAWNGRFALGTDLRAGWGLNDTFILALQSQVSWYWDEVDTGTEKITPTFARGLNGIGLFQYFSEEEESGYLNVTFGGYFLAAPFESDLDSWDALGVSLAFGYEWSSHWSVEARLITGTPSEEGVSARGVSLLLSVIGMAY